MTDLSGFTPRPLPGEKTLVGDRVRLEPWVPAMHGQGLADVLAGEENAHIWDHIPRGPYLDKSTFPMQFEDMVLESGWNTYVILDAKSGLPLGTTSYMRQRPEHGSIEAGCVAFGSNLKRTHHATEAMYLQAAHIFDDLQYRRYEWKCDTNNQASARAAERFGFLYEGVFRNDMVVKGRNRDTAWFAMTDSDWPQVKAAFQAWLDPANFDDTGQQKQSLATLRSQGSL